MGRVNNPIIHPGDRAEESALYEIPACLIELRQLSVREERKVIPAQKSAIVQILVLSAEGCVNTLPTISRIVETAKELKIPINIEKVLICTEEQAIVNRFMGSPTVQINGVDLDPAMRDNTSCGFT